MPIACWFGRTVLGYHSNGSFAVHCAVAFALSFFTSFVYLRFALKGDRHNSRRSAERGTRFRVCSLKEGEFKLLISPNDKSINNETTKSASIKAEKSHENAYFLQRCHRPNGTPKRNGSCCSFSLSLSLLSLFGTHVCLFPLGKIRHRLAGVSLCIAYSMAPFSLLLLLFFFL